MVYMERRELRHDLHTVSLLTDHVVFSPKQPREILVGDVALALEGIIRKTCKDTNIEIIDMAVNVDHVHLCEIPSEVLCELHRQENKREGQQRITQSVSTSQGMVRQRSVGAILFPWFGWSWVGGRGEVHTESGGSECENALYRLCTLVRGLVT